MGTEGATQTVRPKIAAMERGPGPARYALPNLTGGVGHDATKRYYPMYSFGRNLGTSFFKKDFGPGPAHAIDPTITHHGPDGNPHYSLASRHKELVPFSTPGPGAYAPEVKITCFQGEKIPPAYSMSTRTKFRKKDANPSPNSYTLPAMLGPRVPNRVSSACYTMPGRISMGGFDVDYAKTPGPARYNVTTPDSYQKKAPTYTMLARNYMPGDSTKKPGPGAHSPEKVTATKQKRPAYSLGVKHSDFLCPLILDAAD